MNIEDQLRRIDFRDPDQVIGFYETNRLYFDNYRRLEDPEKISSFIDIKLHYANSLFDKSYFDKVLDVLNEVFYLLKKLPTDHWNLAKSERHVRFLRGMILARKKKFKESYPIFKVLVKEDPEHHIYREWYQASKIGLYDWIFNLAAGLGLIMVLADALYFIILKKSLPVDLALLGLTIMVLSLITRNGLIALIKRRNTAPKSNHS